MTRTELIRLAGEKADEYRRRGFHCSESVLRALAEVLELDLGEDLERASTVFRGGGGGYGDRCGAVTGGVMVLSLLLGDRGGAKAEHFRHRLIEEMHRRFTEKMGSNLCSVVKPVVQTQWSSDFSCSLTYRVGAETAIEVLLAQEELAPGEVRVELPVLRSITG